jgi:GT2 family glycosyltransferase
MNTNNKITVIIVLYNSNKLIFECLKSLDKFNIIIVDNGKNSNCLEQLKQKENIKIISKNKNLGYGCGINFAFNYIETEFFLVLNPDVIINEESIIKLLNTALHNKNCAIAAPLNVPDNDSYGILPEKRNLYEKNKDKFQIENNDDHHQLAGEICVDTTKGCALLINSRYFKDVNFFSEKYFLFWEEIDLCRKFLKKKLSIIVNPSSIAHHKQGSSSKFNIKNFFIRTYHNELSPLFYFDIKKDSLYLYKNMLKYFLRIFTYLFILNLKGSLKNFAKLSANLKYILR